MRVIDEYSNFLVAVIENQNMAAIKGTLVGDLTCCCRGNTMGQNYS